MQIQYKLGEEILLIQYVILYKYAEKTYVNINIRIHTQRKRARGKEGETERERE